MAWSLSTLCRGGLRRGPVREREGAGRVPDQLGSLCQSHHNRVIVVWQPEPDKESIGKQGHTRMKKQEHCHGRGDAAARAD